MTTLPTDSEARKSFPLASGCFAYFPAALAGVARWSLLGDRKHNPENEGPPFHARGKSMDHADCIGRHLFDLQEKTAALHKGPFPPSGEEKRALLDEADALAWRALALSQELYERIGNAPVAPAAKFPEDGLRRFVVPAILSDSERKELMRNAGHGELIPIQGPPMDQSGRVSKYAGYHGGEALAQAALMTTGQQSADAMPGVSDFRRQQEEQRIRAMRSRVEGENVPSEAVDRDCAGFSPSA